MAKQKRPIKRYWLRRRGTLTVCQRTPILAKDEDMIPISEEEARRLQKLKAEKDRERALLAQAGLVPAGEADTDEVKRQELIKKGLIPPDEEEAKPAAKPTAKKTLDEMTEPELRKKAMDMKILVHPEASAEMIRDEIRSALGASAAPAKEDQKIEFAEEDPDDLDVMNRNELFAEADKLGVKREGTNLELKIKIRQARKALGSEEEPE